jgi:hypothetical protein
VAAAQLAVDRQIEQRQLSRLPGHAQLSANGPDLVQLQRRLLANQLAFVPRLMCGRDESLVVFLVCFLVVGRGNRSMV